VETGSITSMTGIDDYYVSQSAGNDGARRILQIPEHRGNDNCPLDGRVPHIERRTSLSLFAVDHHAPAG
jgi:hypothetical protein